jgi:RNA polymerase sigma factor (sigma-70 family)
MANSDPIEGNPSGKSDPGPAVPADRVVKSSGRQEIDDLQCDGDRGFLDWGVRQLDDDPALADGWRRFSLRLAPLLGAKNRRGRRSALDQEDAFQEAWLVILAGTSVDRAGIDEEDLSSWDFVVIRNHLADLRRRARLRLSEPLDLEEADSREGREEDPAVAYERDRVRALVRAVLEEARRRMSGTSHRIVVLRGIEGRSYEEIAGTLGMTVSRVRDRHRRAITVLRGLIIRRFGADPAGFLIVCAKSDPLDLDHEVITP